MTDSPQPSAGIPYVIRVLHWRSILGGNLAAVAMAHKAHQQGYAMGFVKGYLKRIADSDSAACK